MENPAQPGDIADRGYSGTADTTAQQTWLDVSFRALRRELSLVGVDLDASVEAESLDVDDIKDVVVAAALRVLRNPEGAEQESGSIDDYQESVKRRDATEDVYFTAAELRRLTPVVTTSTDWAGSVKYS